jgi:lipopolysaccharide heptosyltransferase II
MNLIFQRKLDRYGGAFLCRVLSLIPFRERTVKEDPEKILVILLSEMGSLVLAYPMFETLKKKYPHAAVHALVFKQNREILEIIEAIPKDNIHTIDNQSICTFGRDSLRAIKEIRSLRFDAVVDCELFARVSSIISRLSGAPLRIGFHPYTQEGLYRGSFINRPVLYNPYLHISTQFVTLAEALYSKTQPMAKRETPNRLDDVPQVRLGVEEVEAFTVKLLNDFSVLRRKRMVLFYPSGGILPIRAWPHVYYCRLAQRLLGDGYAVAIIGMKEDKPQAQKIVAHCRSQECVNLTGYTKSIRELMLLFHMADLLITNDGGPGQFAALTPIPSIVFYGPETPWLYRPLHRNAVVFHRSLSCSPCLTAYNHRNSPCDGDNQCLKDIHVEEVYQKAGEILALNKDSGREIRGDLR